MVLNSTKDKSLPGTTAPNQFIPSLILPGLLLRMPRATFLPGAGAAGLLSSFSLLILVIITATAKVSQGQSFIF
jgi:hypothetical protein